jgi:hypothetical protein
MTRNTACVRYKDQFMLRKEIIAVWCENRIKHNYMCVDKIRTLQMLKHATYACH